MDSLEFPISFLNFETIAFAIPRYQKTSPFQQIPFQASVHRLMSWKNQLKHHSFIFNSKGDPRKELISFLKEALGSRGSIVVYNSSFEIGRLHELIRVSPDDEQVLLSFIDRIWDLKRIFEKGLFVHPEFKGSISLKSIFPIICSGAGYKDLGIDNGLLASVKFLEMINTEDREVKKMIRDDLHQYCKRDTQATYQILKKLTEVL